MHQKPCLTLFLWMIWTATTLAVYSVLYRDSGMWSFLAEDNSRITRIILSLFVYGLIGSFYSPSLSH